MKPTDEQLKTAICEADTPFDKVYTWGYNSNGFSCVLKHIERNAEDWWCAYVFVPETLLSQLTDDLEKCDIVLKSVEITFCEKQAYGLYKLGWDYMHVSNVLSKFTGSFESVRADIDEVTLFLKELGGSNV